MTCASHDEGLIDHIIIILQYNEIEDTKDVKQRFCAYDVIIT